MNYDELIKEWKKERKDRIMYQAQADQYKSYIEKFQNEIGKKMAEVIDQYVNCNKKIEGFLIRKGHLNYIDEIKKFYPYRLFSEQTSKDSF